MGKRKHGRQMSREEIIAHMKNVRDIKQSADKSPFTGVATLANYVLWKEDGKGQKRLAVYNQIVNDYETAINAEEITAEELDERLWNKAEFRLEFVAEEVEQRGNSLKDRLNAELIRSNNVINQYARRHLTVHFNALIDLGYGKKRLERNRDQMNDYLKRIDREELHIMQMHKELLDGVGIYIEMPRWQR